MSFFLFLFEKPTLDITFIKKSSLTGSNCFFNTSERIRISFFDNAAPKSNKNRFSYKK
jgi:hypothetical protein